MDLWPGTQLQKPLLSTLQIATPKRQFDGMVGKTRAYHHPVLSACYFQTAFPKLQWSLHETMARQDTNIVQWLLQRHRLGVRWFSTSRPVLLRQIASCMCLYYKQHEWKELIEQLAVIDQELTCQLLVNMNRFLWGRKLGHASAKNYSLKRVRRCFYVFRIYTSNKYKTSI